MIIGQRRQITYSSSRSGTMEKKMKVAVMTDIMTTELVEREIPEIKEDEILVKIE